MNKAKETAYAKSRPQTAGIRHRAQSSHSSPSLLFLAFAAGALPVASLVILGCAVCISVLFHTAMMLVSPVVRWSSVDDAMRESLLLVGVVIAVFAAWAGRVMARNGVVIGRVCGRGADAVFLRRTVAVGVVAEVGYAAGCAPLLIRTACHATWGVPAIASMLADFSALWFLCTFAMVLGAVIESCWSYLVVPLIIVALMLLPWSVTNTVLADTGHSVLSLGVVWMHAFPEVGWVATWQGGVFRCAVFAVASLMVMRYGMARVSVFPVRSDILMWCSAAVCVALTVSSLCWPVSLVRRDADELSCVRESDIELCLHPADEPLRPVITQSAQKVLQLAPQSGAVQLAEYVYDDQEATDGMVMLPIADAASSRESVEQSVVENLAADVSGANICLRADNPSSQELNSAEIATAITSSIRSRLGDDPMQIGNDETTGEPVYSTYQPVLDGLSDTAFSQWYKEHREVIRSCRVSQSDLPSE